MPLFEGRLRMRICGGGAAGSESSWITTPVRTTEPPELKLDFLIKGWKKYELQKTKGGEGGPVRGRLCCRFKRNTKKPLVF